MFEAEKKMHCYACSAEVPDYVKVARTDTCESCLADLYCCKNCKFYDPSAHNECRESIQNYSKDKEKANFCTSFNFKKGEQGDSTDMDDARSKLDNLFK